MTNEQFDLLVNKLEQKVLSNPTLYKYKVILLALLGNAYFAVALLLIIILLIISVALVAMLKFIAIKLVLVLGFFLWMIIKALWIKLEPPTGIEITQKEAPQFFEIIESLRLKLDAPKFHTVLVTDDFNAAILQLPRLGIFGWPKNYLLVGLPLMKSLSVDQFKAVLAHEYGHLARGHGSMSNWIYRQRIRWMRVNEALERQQSRGSFLFKPFLNWFSPYFNAYSFPLARANEYQADATSVALTSHKSVAEALTAVNVIGFYLAERFWPQIHSMADDHPQPSFSPYSNMGNLIAIELDDAVVKSWLDQAIAIETSAVDTHPSLKDRLKAIGESMQIAIPAPNDASDQLLGEFGKFITEELDSKWKDNVLPSWQVRYKNRQEGLAELSELDSKFESGIELTLQDAYRRARLTEVVNLDEDKALIQFKAMYHRSPDNVVACYNLGYRLLARDDQTGCALLEKSMKLDEGLSLSVSRLLRDYYQRTNDSLKLAEWENVFNQAAENHDAAIKERNTILLKDTFEPHGLDDELVSKLKEDLKQIPNLRKAYLLKKMVEHHTNNSCYIFGFSVTSFFQLHSQKRVNEVLIKIQQHIELPPGTLILNVDGDHYRFGRKFYWMRGARVI